MNDAGVSGGSSEKIRKTMKDMEEASRKERDSVAEKNALD